MLPIEIARWTIEPLSLLLIGLVAVLYVRGWRRLHTVLPTLASWPRLAALFVALALLLAATASPLYWWSNVLLAARSVQKIFVVMVAPPLLWLAAPLHIMAYGLPTGMRRRAARLLFSRQDRGALGYLRRPIVAVMGFVTLFLLWHEPVVVDATLAGDGLHLLSIWVIVAVAMLYWSHIVDTGPRMVTRVSGWAAAAYLLAAEVPNMATGVTVAFTGRPLYSHYVAMRAEIPPLTLSPLEDQMIAGAVVWVIGSLVYVSSIVIIVNGIFRREGDDQPIPRYTWDIDENFIAPGLEHRVDEVDYARPNWGDD